MRKAHNSKLKTHNSKLPKAITHNSKLNIQNSKFKTPKLGHSLSRHNVSAWRWTAT